MYKIYYIIYILPYYTIYLFNLSLVYNAYSYSMICYYIIYYILYIY